MRARPLVRRLSSLGRVFVALALLGTLWFGTVRGIDRANRDAEKGRIQDRLLLAKAAARPVQAWLDAGRAEVRQLAGAIGPPASARGAIDGYLRGPHAFGRSVLLVDRGLNVLAASADRLASVGRQASACTSVGEDGAAVDPTFAALVQRAVGAVSSVFSIPGTCTPGVAVAVPTAGGSVVVVIAGIDDVRARSAEAAAVVPDLSVLLVQGDGSTLGAGQDLPLAARPDQAELMGARSAPSADRHRSGDASYVGAFHPTGDGWGVVIDQDAGAFDPNPADRPAITAAAGLTAVFAVVFLLVAWFDVRRQRAGRRADEHRDAFLSIVGHELRTPLTVIKGYTETLASRWDALDDSSRQMLVESMAPQAQRQARVIEHLLTAASLQAGTYARPVPVALPLRPALEQVASEFRPMAPLHEFEVVMNQHVVGVHADSAALVQVLGELVDNAVKYSPSGGSVRIAARPHGRVVEIAVEDDGVGLPADARHLFQPFVQGESVDRRLHDEGGVGVGLYIARSLLEAMGGEIRAERRSDGGSRLIVTLASARVPDSARAGRAL